MPAHDDDLVPAIREFDMAMEIWRSRFAHQQRINPHDTLVISALASAGGPARPREVAQQLRVSSGTLTSMIDRLEAAGLVQRLPHPKDRRSILLALTDAGAASVARIADDLGRALAAAIPVKTRGAFAAHLAEVAQAIRNLPAGGS